MPDDLYAALDWLGPLQGVEWITALRAPQIRTLAADEVLQMSLYLRSIRRK